MEIYIGPLKAQSSVGQLLGLRGPDMAHQGSVIEQLRPTSCYGRLGPPGSATVSS